MIVGIVGLGLMGGSLALDLKELRFIKKIVGYDRNPNHKKEALSLGLVDKIVEFEDIKKCDIIFLAIPVEGIIDALEKLKDVDPDTTIIDLGSTKEKIVNSCPKEIRKNFVAAHPMTGTEKFGPTAAFKGLYKDKIVVLCNVEDSGEKQKELAEDIFVKIGMQIVYMDASEHDKHAAFISHLPHAISYALANSVLKQEDPKSILILAAGGFKDMSRLAKSSPNMWSDIFKQNKKNLLVSIDVFKKELKYAQELIEKEEWEELKVWMQKATTLHKIL
ncbi:prephenate dehydrogenase [Nitrosophilus kaiyonis]|uniref:prephenate dehydrogenase n=1 Tax=Nitrosophilus kaiyonis TaxID=2930200 RepID=UPI0024939CB5|nr:prephenate dehydrogenase [Nitrosophilus kaiyonis]